MPLPRLQPIRRLAALGLAALCGCLPTAPIKVAFISSPSGRVSELAIEGRDGAQLAVETLNGRTGPRYELRLHDDAHAVTRAADAIDAAAEEGDAFAVGPMTSVDANDLATQAARRRLVLISPTANSDDLHGIDDYLFRLVPTAALGAEQLADAAIARGLRSAAIMTDSRNRAYSESFAKSFATRYVALGGSVGRIAHDESSQNTDYAKVAETLLSTRPQVVLLICSAPDASVVAHQLHRRDPAPALAIAAWAANLKLLQLGGANVEGALVLQAVDIASQAPAYLDFSNRFMARFGGPPSQAALLSYEAVMLGAEGLQRKTETQSLRDALRVPGNWPGLQEPLVLDRFGDSKSRFRLSEVRGGRFVMLPT
jgi:branched-chain amino acid transport system substrate-binding protein